jgi:hypothetical protein
LTRHAQAHDAELSEEHNVDVIEAVERVRERLAEALAEYQVLHGLVARGDSLLRTTGRAIYDKPETFHFEHLERQLEAIQSAAGADALPPRLPLPREAELQEQDADPEVHAARARGAEPLPSSSVPSCRPARSRRAMSAGATRSRSRRLLRRRRERAAALMPARGSRCLRWAIPNGSTTNSSSSS